MTTTSPSTVDDLLDAGAVLDGPSPDDPAVAAVTGRAYAHPALPGRTVVRLVSEPVGAAEDLSMEFLGFTGAGAVPVGHGRVRALGFPASALVQDPAHGRQALALVKEMEKLARLARSKPGNARDGYLTVAARLAGTVPQFLPGFWEQAGRSFIEAENLRQAAICFGEARRAEQTYALTVDEARLRDAHLEFALAGALSAKALRDYARDALTRAPAASAYSLVRSVAVRRVAGGLPPGPGLAADLRRLAKAAGLDAAAEDESVVAELLMLPAVVRADAGFWTAYRKPLQRLARRDPAVAARLLELLPEPPGWQADVSEEWLDLIIGSGVLDAPDADITGWLDRFAWYRARHRWAVGAVSPQLLALVERLAPRLRAAGRPLRPGPADGSGPVDLNLVDTCLAHGVPVSVEPTSEGLPVTRWYGQSGEGRRDLAAIAADPNLLPDLVRGLWRLLDQSSELDPAGSRAEGLIAVLAATPGLLTALRHGVAQRPVDGVTVAGLAAVLRELYPLWSAAGVRLAPGELRRIAAIDTAEVLAGSLRAGLVDELGWPAYETAVVPLKRIGLSPSWPTLAASDQTRVVTVSPDGASAEHRVRLPSGAWHADITCHESDGRLLVSGSSYHGDGWAYWADHPERTFPVPRMERAWESGPPTPYLPLPGGGVTGGGRPCLPGDPAMPAPGLVSSDGVTYWRCEQQPGGPRWREYDPHTGEPGRHSLPAFFTDGAPEQARLLPEWSWLRPAPEAFAGSPLGSAGGLLGWRVHLLPDGTQAGWSADGRTLRWRPTVPGEVLVGALRLPGDELLRPVTTRAGERPHPHDLAVTVWSPDGGGPLQECVAVHSRPPFPYWHALRPRDVAGSAALRAVTTPLAAALLADLRGNALLDYAVDQVFAKHLPEVTEPTLLRALRAVARTALRMETRLAALRELLATVDAEQAATTASEPDRVLAATTGGAPHDRERTPPGGDLPSGISPGGEGFTSGAAGTSAAGPRSGSAVSQPEVSDTALSQALGALVMWRGRYFYGSRDHRTAVMDQISAVSRVFADPPEAVPPPNAESAWPWLLPGLGAVLMVAASPVGTPEARSVLARLLRAFAASPFAAPDPRFRFAELAVTAEHTVPEIGEGGRRVVFLSGGQHALAGADPRFLRYAVDHCADGVFAPIAGVDVRTDIKRGGWGDADRLNAAADLLDREGPMPWRADGAARLAELTGLTRAESVLLLAGLPIGGWSRHSLSTAQRRTVGLAGAEADLAAQQWHLIPHGHRLALLDAAVPDDPADLWRHGPDVDALAARWLALYGRRTPLPEELLIEAKRVVPGGVGQEVLRVIAEPRPRTWLCTDGVTEARPWEGLVTHADDGEAFDEDWLRAAAAGLAWLAYRLPAGDPLRPALPRALDLVRRRLENPKLAVGTTYHRPGLVPDGLPGVWCSGERDGHAYHLLPAAITAPDDPALALGERGVTDALLLLRDPALVAAFAEADALPAGAWPQDPRHTAPGLVATVAAAHALAPDAAAYYLQLLALPDPTDAHAARWLGVTTARLKPLRAALLAAGLVVEARRERAGRTVFLPGGWLSLKAPALPVEAWKAPLLGLLPDAAPPLGAVLLGRPVADLFYAAWERVEAGGAGA
ncbi:hypothetical protein Cme02nite_19520 [Catellatospora methionotrophica]|uniref:DNA-binding protein n=1 Tax=Catellatospora methionotrophica TaxID=121620 RepID=A0A8J3LJ58_9ACTN|nr:hypothetical protein [Catellatospora methionotrophica]GIG13620.1 hypothetical protein Cme02nite_19520 [Catellatospora methionotrophica]